MTAGRHQPKTASGSRSSVLHLLESLYSPRFRFQFVSVCVEALKASFLSQP